MAVDDVLSRDTDTLVLPTTSFYPADIPIAHYQLRHFISSPEPDLVYYASKNDLYCLNAATRTQAHVTTLPWEARCTAAGHGYICVGGAESGNFAVIKVAGFPPTAPSDVDASLPLDFHHRLPRPPVLGAARQLRLEKIGEDIVNSISIHKFSTETDGHDDVVAVLTNNDKTVRIYSLVHNLELTVLDLPFAMNHATISPDGKLLAAVGDHPTCFFYERIDVQPSEIAKLQDRSVQPFAFDWEMMREIELHRTTISASADGYFSTAWSPHGRLCAVGSERGYITVFDVPLLQTVEYGEDAIVRLIPSTRPDTDAGAGAVRTIHFSPNPWDLLVWSEDQGRVCVADLRCGLKVKQVLNLDPKAEDLEKVEIADFELSMGPEMHELHREADFIRSYRRALDSDGTAAAVNAANEYLEAESDRSRQHQRMGVVESDNDPHGLTAHERQVLETLRSTRIRLEEQEQSITPRSINYNTGRHSDSAARRDTLDVMAEFMPQTFRRWSRLPQERTAPRRQASIVVSIDPGTVNVPASVQANITDSAPTRSPNIIPAHAQRMSSDIVTSTEDAWRTIEEALTTQARAANARAAASGSGHSSSGPTNLPELRTELRQLRQFTQQRERLRNARASQPAVDALRYSIGIRRQNRYHIDRSLGPRTAGLAMSQDGRTLYCGTEEGIFEFKMNLHVRKAFPAVQPR